VLAVLALAVVPVMLTSCAVESAEAGGFGFECPTDGLVQISLLDISASGRHETILGERLDAVQVDTERAADCEGELVVIAWAGSSSSSRVLFAGQVGTQGATEIGRDRKIPEVVTEVMTGIKDELQIALEEIPADGSDLIGGFYLVSDVVQARASLAVEPSVRIYSDAISTGGTARINDPWVTQQELSTIVAAQTLPDLTGVSIGIHGVGRVAGVTPPPQDYVQLVQEYARGLCARTGADCELYTTVVAL